MDTFKSAAIQILTEAGKPMHSKEITRLALEKGILETSGSTPENTMNSQISRDIRKKIAASDFIQTDASTFSINPNKQVLQAKQQQKVSAEEAAEEEKINLETGYTGKAGEHLVCSELLFRGYNASIMSVDDGMDIIATRNNKLFSIQVKTANANKFKTYNFNVRKISFEKSHAGNTFYVFVLRHKSQKQFLIIPLHELEKKVKEQAISYVKSGNMYRVKIDERDNKIYLGNRDHEIKYYLDNWSIIK